MDILETAEGSVKPLSYYFQALWPDGVLMDLHDDERRRLHIDARYISVDAVWQEPVISTIAQYAHQLYRQDGRRIVLVRSDGVQVASWP